jgi:murein DD-endopeptidase MepM/ murein hydrolase activator NlpD
MVACGQDPGLPQSPLGSTPSLRVTDPVPSNTAQSQSASSQGTTPSVEECNPSVIDYCVTAGTFLLHRPIAQPWNDIIDRGYAYGSTARGARDPHHGVEFDNPSGTPVLAAADGKVFFAGDDSQTRIGPRLNFYGNLVILEHHLGTVDIYTLYAHLSKINIHQGWTVLEGEEIAEVGATGAAIGSHLHFEVRLDPVDYGTTLNPELWLLPIDGTGVLAMRFIDKNNEYLSTEPNIQYYPDPAGTFIEAWQPGAYAPDMGEETWENSLVGNLPAGRFRISYTWKGFLLDRWVQIQPGKLTRVEFILN